MVVLRPLIYTIQEIKIQNKVSTITKCVTLLIIDKLQMYIQIAHKPQKVMEKIILKITGNGAVKEQISLKHF